MYIFILLCVKTFSNLQWMKSINLVIKNDERHCMPHRYIHATLYSMHRLVVPSGNEKLERIFYRWRFLFWKFWVSVERNECVSLPSETIFHENSHFSSFKMMRIGSPSSYVYRTFLSAVIRTFNPLSKFIEALTSDFVQVSLKITKYS